MELIIRVELMMGGLPVDGGPAGGLRAAAVRAALSAALMRSERALSSGEKVQCSSSLAALAARSRRRASSRREARADSVASA